MVALRQNEGGRLSGGTEDVVQCRLDRLEMGRARLAVAVRHVDFISARQDFLACFIQSVIRSGFKKAI
jgi:hypothetical protein